MVSKVTFIKDGKQITVESKEGETARETVDRVKNTPNSSTSDVQGPVRPTTDETQFRQTGSSTPRSDVQGPVRQTTDEPTFRESGQVTPNRQATLKPIQEQMGAFQGPLRPTTAEAQFRATGVAEQTVVASQQAKTAARLERDRTTTSKGEIAALAGLGAVSAGIVGASAAGVGVTKGAATLFTAFQAPKAGEFLSTKTLNLSQREFIKSKEGITIFKEGAAQRDAGVAERGSFSRLGKAVIGLRPGKAFGEFKGLASEGVGKLSTIGGRQDFLIGAGKAARATLGRDLTVGETQALVAARAGRAGGELIGIGIGGASAELIGAKGIAKGFAVTQGTFSKATTSKIAVGQTIKPLVKAGAVEGAAVELAGTSARKGEFSPIRTTIAAGAGALSAATIGVGLVKAQSVGRTTGKAAGGVANILDPTEVGTDIVAGVARKGASKLGRKTTKVPIITATGKDTFSFGVETVKSPTTARRRSRTKLTVKTTKTEGGLIIPKNKITTISRPSAKEQTFSRPLPESRTDARSDTKPTSDTRPVVDTRPTVQPFIQTDPRVDVKPSSLAQARSQTTITTKTQVRPFTTNIIAPPLFKPGGGGSNRGTRRTGSSRKIIGAAPSLTAIVKGTAKKRKKRF